MKKLLYIILALVFSFGMANAQSPYGVKKLKKLNQIGKQGDTDSLVIYKPASFRNAAVFKGLFNGIWT